MDIVVMSADPSTASDLAALQSRIGNATTLEELLLLLPITAQNPATIAQMNLEGRDFLAIQVITQSANRLFLSIDSAEVRRNHRIMSLDEAALPLSDGPGGVINEEWLGRRNKLLGIRTGDDGYTTYSIVRPSSCIELILSYAMSPMGLVSIQRDMFETRTGIHDGLKMHLACLSAGNGLGIEENIWVDEAKLKTFTQKRRARTP